MSVGEGLQVALASEPAPVPHFANQREGNIRLTEFDGVQRIQHKLTGEIAAVPELQDPLDRWTLFNQDGWGVLKCNTAAQVFASELLAMTLFCDQEGDLYIEKKDHLSGQIATMFQRAAKA